MKYADNVYESPRTDNLYYAPLHSEWNATEYEISKQGTDTDAPNVYYYASDVKLQPADCPVNALHLARHSSSDDECDYIKFDANLESAANGRGYDSIEDHNYDVAQLENPDEVLT